jgi:hypothetical protein
MFLVLAVLARCRPVPILLGNDLRKFLQNSHRCVVFFLAGVLHVSDAGFDLGEFENRIDFVESTKEEGLNYSCSAFPCLVPFADGISLKSMALPTTSISFSEWLQEIASIDTIQINNTEQAQVLLEGNGSYTFAVDFYQRPLRAPPGATIYLIPSILLKGEVPKGVYLYSPSLHKFTAVEYAKPDFTEPQHLKFGHTRFMGGFMVHKSSSQEGWQTAILSVLGREFPKNFTFTSISGKPARLLKRHGRLELVAAPYFFVIDLYSKSRWVVRDAQMTNVSFLAERIAEIEAGTLPPTVISEPVPDQSAGRIYRKLVYSNFEAAISAESEESVVLFTAPWSVSSKKFEAVMRRTASVLQYTNIRFYHFDAAKNQLLDRIEDQIFGLPTILVWPSGRKEEKPILYSGKAKVSDLVEFLDRTATKKFPLPDLDAIETGLIPEESSL